MSAGFEVMVEIWRDGELLDQGHFYDENPEVAANDAKRWLANASHNGFGVQS